ncbi:MAG: hypothetical protein ACFFDN_41225, partial [Candidatus Hodarchaeota archaeon]
IIITNFNREAEISGYGLVLFEDSLTIKNLNNNPISSIFYGLPTYEPEDLVFFKATGTNQNTLLAERSNLIMNGFEMIVIYFNSPLLPHQTRTIKYRLVETQVISLAVLPFPLLPYKIEGDINAIFKFPEDAINIQTGWGVIDTVIHEILYAFDNIKYTLGIDFITPFLENLGDYMGDVIDFEESTGTKTEMKEINREIFISPWGIIRVKEEFSLQNLGEIEFYTCSLKIPKHATNLYISDDLGEILGVTIENSPDSEYKVVEINLLINRVKMTPNSIFIFNVEYNLPFENHISVNWLQESIQIDLLTTVYDYLGRDETINVIIDGCYNIDSITYPPDAIKKSQGATILVYESDFVSPFETKVIQFTFTINIFDILLRPIIFILIIAVIASAFVLITKTRMKEYDKAAIKREFIPVNEIREFCSLYEEKNALTLEIRQAEEDAKRRRMAKKKYKNILSKNTSKIDEIQQEIIPFKKAIIETSETFESIIKRLDVLDAERVSVKDSLSLLESRYKRGRLPSRAAYEKLSDDFKKRRKKIDRTIDKVIQQLRSYLL